MISSLAPSKQASTGERSTPLDFENRSSILAFYMAQERQHEHGPVSLRAIHIVLEALDGRLTKLSFTPGGTFDLVSQIAAFSGASITERSVEQLTAAAEAAAGAEPRETS